MAATGTSTLRICGDGHANAIAVNRDFNHLAIAGRSLLKVYSVEQEEFIEICNLRSGKNQNLSYSSNDVAWSVVDNHILATAATNGVVTVWDLSKFGRQKQQFVYMEHERTTHTVTFHGTESHLLISGSQDGNIKCFDLRVEKAVNTYFCNSESIRDVKFSPQVPNTFAAVSESGTVQLWDLRRPDKCTIQYTAHSGPIYTCDWHPTQPWLATGSRDKLVKIWNTEHKPTLEHTLTTIAVVGKVKWRPDRMHNIASASLVADYSIYVWDLRRPYLPYIAFDDHTNVVTGIAWKGDDPGVLLSSSKDSRVLRHTFRDASPPSGKPSSQGISVNLSGDLLFSYKAKNIVTTSIPTTRSSFITGGKQQRIKQQTVNDQFHLAKSTLIDYTAKPAASTTTMTAATAVKDVTNTLLKDFVAFHGCAKEYVLTGRSLAEMCEHNAHVAKRYGKSNVCVLWRFVKNQYEHAKQSVLKVDGRGLVGGITTPTNQAARGVFKLTPNSGGGGGNLPPVWDDTGPKSLNCTVERSPVQLQSINDDALLMSCLEDVKRIEFKHSTATDGSAMLNGVDSGEDAGGASANGGATANDGLTTMPINGPNGNKQIGGGCMQPSVVADTNTSLNNFIYGDVELTVNDMDCVKGLRNGFLFFGPHDLTREWTLPDHSIGHDLQTTAMATNENNRHDSSPTSTIPSVLRIISQPTMQRWEPHKTLADTLTLHADIGDVQSAVCILIVLGDRRNELPIDKITCEMWLLDYVEFLQRHQLWNEAAEIINVAWIRTVYELNQKSTSVNTMCSGCRRTLPNKSKWYCNNCKSAHSSKCSVCNRVVTGLYAWCQGCSHGGHLDHLKQWFLNNSKCAKCEHLCEYE